MRVCVCELCNLCARFCWGCIWVDEHTPIVCIHFTVIDNKCNNCGKTFAVVLKLPDSGSIISASMHSINLEKYEGEGELAKSTRSNPSPVDCIDEEDDVQLSQRVEEQGEEQEREETDENDNSSRSQKIIAPTITMRPTTLERLFDGTGRMPERSESLNNEPGAFALLKDQMKLESVTAAMAPSGPQPCSNIILHRTYNKKPSQTVVAGGESVEDDSCRCLSPAMHPVVSLEDIRVRIGLPELVRAGSLSRADGTAGRPNNVQSCIIRRSFHKDGGVAPGIAKISLEQESSHSDGGKEASNRRISYSYAKKDHFVAQPTVLLRRCDTTAAQKPATERMDVCEEEPVGTNNADEAVEASSMANSFGDDDSSDWSKHLSTQHSLSHRRKLSADGGQQPQQTNALSEFDLMLQKINQSVPPMSHLDRIDQWRVTAEDLLHSIPTKAQIETSSSSCAKRPHYYDADEGSSDEDSDPLEDDAAGAAAAAAGDGPCTSAGLLRSVKKRRTINDVPPLDSPNSAIANPMSVALKLRNDDEDEVVDTNGLDFRKSQVNPEIDKVGGTVNGSNIRILTRKNYYKLPTRYRADADQVQEGADRGDEAGNTCAGLKTTDGRYKANPYAYLLSRDEEERDKFLQYLRISPVFRTEEQALSGHRAGVQVEKRNGMLTAEGTATSVTPVVNSAKAKANSRPKATQHKRKPASKHRAHPTIIASSGLRGVRRLVLTSSLRSGKVIRYRNGYTNLRSVAKSSRPERKKVHGAESIEKKQQQRQPSPKVVDKPDKQPSPGEVKQSSNASSPSSSTPVMAKKAKSSTQRPRCSVDSAVSSSTSAEMHEQVVKRSKECQTIESIPPGQPPAPVAIVNEGKRMRNPLNRADGEVLHLFLLGEQLVVVQKEVVSFWRYSRLSVFLGVKQEWQRVAQIRRWNRDTEVDVQNASRIVFNKQDPIYLEPRARNLSEDKARACPLVSIYVNAYFLDMVSVGKVAKVSEGNVSIAASDDIGEENEDEEYEEQLRLKSFQLDTVKSSLEDIRFMPLPNSRDFLVCWHEHVSVLESRTGLCKYSLTPDIQTLACIREFMTVKQKLNALKCINDKKLIGLGDTSVHIWCYESGFILHTVDLKLELGLIVCCFLHIEENNDNTLMMWQMHQSEDPASSCNRKVVKVIALNLYKATWYIAHSYDIALASLSITSESQQWALDDNHAGHRHCLTFDSGELLTLSLNDPTVCWTNHPRLEKDLQRADKGSLHIYSRLRSNDGGIDLYRPRERILNGGHWNGGRDLVFLSDQLLTVKTIDEYMQEESKR
ncbi:uncharacterized protein LOC120905166 [Anopheles arabiensis]|uniref:Uncharacterized protein n=1 Tax=Anopheles arabiensis TaxID=7173 RepID=A0A182IEK6_ANOAR|nr:uncharacterized protein LOC120905166 [Anopheles arabiensis]